MNRTIKETTVKRHHYDYHDQLARHLQDLIAAYGVVTPFRTCDRSGGSIANAMQKISYAGYRFPPEILRQAIWLYLRFTLSFRDVEDLLAERGIGLWSRTRPFGAGSIISVP